MVRHADRSAVGKTEGLLEGAAPDVLLATRVQAIVRPTPSWAGCISYPFQLSYIRATRSLCRYSAKAHVGPDQLVTAPVSVCPGFKAMSLLGNLGGSIAPFGITTPTSPAPATPHFAIALLGVDPREPLLEKHPGAAQGGEPSDGNEISPHSVVPQVAVNRPEKPMKAVDRMLAIMRLMAVPRIKRGTGASSVSCRRPAISTKARVKPSPDPRA